MFVGREDELHQLHRLVKQVALGRGGGAWVAGDAGIGKSTLIAAALATAQRQGCRVYSAAAHEQSPAFPLRVLLEALGVQANGTVAKAQESDSDPLSATRTEIVKVLRGDRTELVTPDDAVAAAAEGLITLVHRLCTISPTILVLDDAQWSDEASLRVLLTLGKALHQLPLLLVIAARPVPRRAAVDVLREALTSAEAIVLELGPIGPRDAVEMLRHLVGVPPGPVLAEQLNAAGGNPLYLRELIDALVRESRLGVGAEQVELLGSAADLPATLPAAIARRLSFLSEATMAALRVAAVLGPTFTTPELGIVTGQRGAELIEVTREAVDAGVLVEATPGALTFRHELVHQTMYHGMPASLRAALHRQAAELLAAAKVPAEQVAVQLLAAPHTLDAWIIDWIGETAALLSRRAPLVAVELLQRCSDGLDWQDPRHERVDAALAMVQLMLGNNEQVVRLARPLLESTRDPAMAGEIAWTLAYALPRLGRVEDAIEVTDQALARDGLPLVWSARLRARRAMSLFAVGRYDTARADGQRGEAEGAQADDRLAMGYSLYTLAQLEFVDRRSTASAKDVVDRALAVLAEEPQAIDLLLLLRASLGGALAALGQYAAADHTFAQVAVLAERATPPRQAHVRALGAVYAFYRGRWDEALSELDAATQLPLDVSYQRYLSGVAAQVAVHRDDLAAAHTYLQGAEHIQLVDSEVRILVEFLLVAWALAAERDANPAVALDRLLATFDPDGTGAFSRLGVISTQWLPDVVRLALTVGEPAVAAAAAEACARAAAVQARPTPHAAAQHCQGLLDGDPMPVRDAAQSFHQVGYPLFSAQALENAAVLYAEKGDRDSARVAHLEAVEIYQDLDAAWDIMRADARLRQHNVRRGASGSRRRPTVGWEALTPTEQKVAHLVAAGRSNPDIASQLFLSRYTVQSHVSHILAKLNARSRLEIARAVAGR